MSKMSTDPTRYALHGPTMGTRWSAQFHADPSFDPESARGALQTAVDEVDAQMSTWKPDSDLMRLNAAPVGVWQAVPARLLDVLVLGRDVGRASGGAFDMGLGDAVAAWGFGADEADPTHIRAAMARSRVETALE
ncbi:MAG: FAD:protein FMN transferase, partial [Albidovulum sp.]